MMRTTWIVQTNVEAESTSPNALRRACWIDDRPFREIAVVAGSPVLPAMPEVDGPIVFHGRTTLILRASEHPRWRHGVFYDADRFQHSAYAAGYGDDLLNADARVTRWDEFVLEARDPDELLFLKPNDDLKLYTGGVMSFAECLRLYERLRSAARPMEPSAEVVIGRRRELDAEWRLFLVNGQVVSGSMYRPSGDAHVPQDVVDFAERAAGRWMPASVFVMDVARTEGTWKIVECNCFNGSRFYAADVLQIVRSVSNHQERMS
jgi:hypothetical protein